MVDSKIILSNSDTSSYVKYRITVYNSSSKDYMYMGMFYDDEFYSNVDIICDVTNLNLYDAVKPGEYLNFEIVFKYNNGVSLINNNLLESYLNFKFEPIDVRETLSGIEFNYLVKNGVYAPEGDVYEYYSVDGNRLVDNSIKVIVFGKTSDYLDEVSSLVSEPIDVYRTGSISLYRQLLDDGKYKIYILSNSGKFILNENSAWMFDKLYVLEEIINLHLLNTSNVVNMRDMFCDCASLKNVDLSNFDTSNVTNMIGMFARMTNIEYLDLSTFDVSNVVEMGQMFTTDSSLKRIYVNSDWLITDKVLPENGAGVFTACNNLVGGNGTVFDSTKVTYTMAKIDGSSPGYLTVGYEFASGIDFNHKVKNLSQTQIDAWTITTRYSNVDVNSITFGKTSDYYDVVSKYSYVNADGDSSGVIRIYRVLNSNNMYDVFVLSNSGKFVISGDASWMFDKLIFLKSINNLSLLDTSGVTIMRDVFCDCQYLTSLDLSNFSTSNVTSMVGLFARMYMIEVLDLTNFNTKNVVDMTSMFSMNSGSETHESLVNVVPALKTIYVSNKWDTSKATDVIVFTNNVNLVGGNGTTFNASNVGVSYARVDKDGSSGYLTLK